MHQNTNGLLTSYKVSFVGKGIAIRGPLAKKSGDISICLQKVQSKKNRFYCIVFTIYIMFRLTINFHISLFCVKIV